MNPSRAFLKSLSAAERNRLTELIKEKRQSVSGTHLFMVGNGTRNPSRKLAAVLEIVTDGKVSAADFDNEIREKIK